MSAARSPGAQRPHPKPAERIEYHEDLRLARALCFALYTTTHKLSRIYGSLLQPYKLTLPQALALMVLWERSPRTVGDVAEALELELDNGTVTPLLKRLESNGLVSRIRDVVDERRVPVHILPKGLALKAPIIELRRSFMANIAIAADEIEALRLGIASFSERLAGGERPAAQGACSN